ncbi:MAG: redoxin domain-containing protein [Synechococcales cyanobacterium C42_A2020_086]|jgi:peroxiredoxin|nr:redoxin domain-containing protein [Synechococcales cyanobacterium C42_A2020_086]
MLSPFDLDGLLTERFLRNFLPIPATHQSPLGVLAPPFELLNVASGEKVRLADFTRTSWVILALTRIFTEKHYCPLCYPHIMEMNAAYKQFREYGAEVVMITSTDAHQSQIVRQDLELKMPLLSDPSCRVFRQYRVGQALGAPLPAQFVIDPQGRIRFRHLFSFLEPNASVERLLAVLKAQRIPPIEAA